MEKRCLKVRNQRIETNLLQLWQITHGLRYSPQEVSIPRHTTAELGTHARDRTAQTTGGSTDRRCRHMHAQACLAAVWRCWDQHDRRNSGATSNCKSAHPSHSDHTSPVRRPSGSLGARGCNVACTAGVTVWTNKAMPNRKASGRGTGAHAACPPPRVSWLNLGALAAGNAPARCAGCGGTSKAQQNTRRSHKWVLSRKVKGCPFSTHIRDEFRNPDL